MNNAKKLKGLSTEETFSYIYETAYWKAGENKSFSGKGSDLKHTQNTRSLLPEICQKYGIKRILDCACGDFNWMKEIVSTFEYYKGVDIVKDLIEDNHKKYFQKDLIEFEHGNAIEKIVNDKNFDAVILRDVLVHLPAEDIQKIITNLRNSGIQYVFATNFKTIDRNTNLKIAGQWRPVNLLLEPFNFDKPLEEIEEISEAYRIYRNGKYIKLQDKTLSLWKI
jgi:2-polyprenyl-3-methyl-5-hydroxy-6-metoxy-1,4-benzoquinol methylase